MGVNYPSFSTLQCGWAAELPSYSLGCYRSESLELSATLCGAAAANKSPSTESARDGISKVLTLDGVWLSYCWWLFCFPGVSVTSSNTGVPDISGSVYNKTQVSNAKCPSLVA